MVVYFFVFYFCKFCGGESPFVKVKRNLFFVKTEIECFVVASTLFLKISWQTKF